MRSSNGASDLSAAIARELPLDLVIIMLGANDMKAGYERTPECVAEGAMTVAWIAGKSQSIATTYDTPNALVVMPPPFGPFGVETFAQFYAGAAAKSAAS